MKTFAYLRVSGLSQVDGDGERRQREACAEFARQHNLLPMGTIFEKGVSGTVVSLERPEFFTMLSMCEPGDGIIVERLDRLARDLMVQELTLKECRERGVKVFAVDQGQPIDLATNEGDPTRKLMRQMMGALAEWEKTMLVLKLKKSRDAKRARGEYCGGYRAYGATEEEQKILGTMRVLSAAGNSENEIAEILNLNQLRTRRGQYWTKKNVKALLNGWNLRKHRKEVAGL
jgi:DNA invertase Pin-like site-specific DNA recombinase